MNRVNFAVVFFALLMHPFTPAAAFDMSGSWAGTWTKQDDALPVDVTFEKSGTGYSGYFDSDALQVSHIPLADVSDTNGKVHFVLKGDTTTAIFDGTLVYDALSGAFTDGDTKGTFALHRTTPLDSTIEARNVEFHDGEVTLEGTLLNPATPGNHSAILFLQGSGPEGRWANRYLAEKFATAGFVALIYDKRGVGQSTGDWQEVGFGPLADDAVAGIRYLQSLSNVDFRRVGIYGHSQGGTIAPLVATKAGDLGFVIASAAGGIDPAQMEIYSVENSIGLSTLTGNNRRDADRFVRTIIDVAYRGAGRAKLDSLAMKYKSRSWFFDPPPADNSYWTTSRLFSNFNPSRYWRRVKAPVLLVYGAHDERVQPNVNARAITAALNTGGNKRVTLKIYSSADHTLTIVDPPTTGGWSKHAPDYAATLTTWARMQD